MRPRPLKEKMLTLRIPEDIYNKLDYIAEQKWTNISTVVRHGIRKELEANEELFEDEFMQQTKHYMKQY